MAHNFVEKLEDFEHLTELLELSVLDLSNNHIDDVLIVEVLARMPGLRVLNLMGNPVIRKVPAYRKTLILACVSGFFNCIPEFYICRCSVFLLVVLNGYVLLV